MKKYKFITDIDARKIVVDDLDNNRATIYWHNGKIEKNANCRYKTDGDKCLWFDSLHDCIIDRLQDIDHMWVSEDYIFSEELMRKEHEEEVAMFLRRLVLDNPLEEVYKD